MKTNDGYETNAILMMLMLLQIMQALNKTNMSYVYIEIDM